MRNSHSRPRSQGKPGELIGYLTYAAGAPCPTLVLDARSLPRTKSALLMTLTEIRRWLIPAGGGHVLKFALVEPSRDPTFDLDYRFIQALPRGPDSFDLRGSCGHSLLGASMASADFEMTSEIKEGRRTRVNVLNNGDRVVCDVEDVSRGTATFTARFRYAPPRAVGSLLLTGDPRTTIDVGGKRVPVTLVSTGNPYAFVDASSLGVRSVDELFAGHRELLERLIRIRRAAATLLGWSPEGAFPKVAATLPAGVGGIAVRAVSVPGWHPTLALTGSVCLAATINIANTIPWAAARAGGSTGDSVEVHTPGGRWPVSVAVAAPDEPPRLTEISVGRRQVTRYGSLRIELPSLGRKEDAACLPLSA